MKQLYLKNRSSLEITAKDKCIGCGMCVDVCPHNVFKIVNSKVEIINKEACMECGACKKNCPVSIIAVNSGVGCAYAVLKGIINKSEPTCGCDDKGASSCC